MAPVLVVTPPQVVFQDVKPGEVQSQYVTISNPLTSPVGFTIKPSAARYRLEPDEGRIELRPGTVIQVLVELHMPPKSTRTGAKESYKDMLHIKSNYFDQKVKILVNPSPDGGSPRPSPYNSPSRARSATTSPHRSPARPRRHLYEQGGGGGAGPSQEPRPRSPFRAVEPSAPQPQPPPAMPTPWEGAEAMLEELHDLPSEVRLVMEEEGRRLRRTLTREFNDKCERYMQLFAAKDELLREKDGLLLEKEHALEAAEGGLARARNRVRELEARVKGQEDETARWQRERDGEKERTSRQWAEREARWKLEQTDRDERLRVLQAEVEQRRQQQAKYEEKEGQWRLEQTDLQEMLVALQTQLEASTQGRADSESKQARWQRREAELEKTVRQLQVKVTELHAQQEEKEGQWRLEQADMGEKLGSLQEEKEEVLRKNGQLRAALTEAEAAHVAKLARVKQEKEELLRQNETLRQTLAEAEAADTSGKLARLEGERETRLRANEALRATLAKAQADDTSEVLARLEGEIEGLARTNDHLRASLAKAEADTNLATRERDKALLLLTEASNAKPDIGREAPSAQAVTSTGSRRPSLADQAPPPAPAATEARQEADGTDELLLRLLKDKVADQKEQIDVLVAELDRVRASQQQSSAEVGATAALEQEVTALREALVRSEASLHTAQASLQQAQEERQQLQRRVRSLEHMQATARELLLHQTAAGGGLDRGNARRHRSSSPQPRHRHRPAHVHSSSDGDEDVPTSDNVRRRRDPCLPADASASDWDEAQGWWRSLAQHEQQAADREEEGDGEDEGEALRDAGVEIARLRQELLAKDMQAREAARACDERIRAADRRMLRLEQALRGAREENKLKVHELETSVRVLSGRGDLHRALACVRQELAQQRVQTMQLQGEVELHRRLSHEAADHAAAADARTADMQARLDCQQVQLSLHAVPGISRPLVLIQHFAGLMAAGCATIQELRHRMASALGKRGRAKRTTGQGRRNSDPRPVALPAQDERPQEREKDAAEEREARLPPSSMAQEEAAPRGRERPAASAPREVSEVYVTAANAAGEEDREEEEEEEDEVALSQRFTDRMERAQLAERRARAEEELASVKEEALRLRLEVEGMREQGKREAAALEEAQRSVTAALQRRVTVAEEERRRAEEKAGGWRDRVLLLEQELVAERALGGVREEKEAADGEEDQEGEAGERERKGRDEEDGRRRGRRRGIDGVLGLGGAEVEEEERGGEEETKRLASMLQEKTAQVSVLMESVEALQGAVLASREVEREEAGLLSGNWAVSKLVKRVASLTMDLSHAQAMQAIAERRAERLSREGEGREREGVERDKALEAAQERARRATARAAAVAEEYARVSRSRDEEARRMEAQIEALQRRLLESESSLLSTGEHRAELQERLHHLEAIMATGHPSLPSTQHPWAALDTSDSDTPEPTWQPPADVFCHACGALTLPPHTRPPPPTPSSPPADAEEPEIEELTSKDKASYQALLQSMLGQMEAWHGEAMAAALAHPLHKNPDGGSGGPSPPPPPTFLEFFMDTVADLMADADGHYVRVLHRARELEWKLRTTRLQLLHEAKGRQAAGHRAKALDQTLVAYREALIRRKRHEESSSSALADVGMDPVWLTQRWRQQCETLRHLDSRVAWLEGERQRLSKEAAVEKEARKREARRAEEAEAREREREAEERGLARKELDEVVLPRLEERVRHWCEHEMPLLLCGPAKPPPQGSKTHPPRLEKDTLALVEALCVSKAVIAALETRLEAALCDLDRCRQESRDLVTALHSLLSSQSSEDPEAPAPTEDNSDLPLTTLAPPPTHRLRQRLMELEEQVCQVREARDRTDRLLRTLAAENEALRATAELQRGEDEEDKEEEMAVLKRELARMAAEVQKGKEREEALRKRMAEGAGEYGGAAASVQPISSATVGRQGQDSSALVPPTIPVPEPLPPPPEQADQHVTPPQPPAATSAAAGSNDPEVLSRQLGRLEAQCRLLEEEVLTKDAALRALHQSMLSVTATALLQRGHHEDAGEVARLVEELMDSRLGEARALRRLSLACEAEAALRQHITHLQEALTQTDGRTRQADRLETTLLFGAYGQGEAGGEGLAEQVRRQAGIIAYLELRLAQATAAEAAAELQHIRTREGQDEEEEEEARGGQSVENAGRLMALEDTMSDPPPSGARAKRHGSHAQRSPSLSPASSPSSSPRRATFKAPRSPARPEGKGRKAPGKGKTFADSVDTLGPMPRRQGATGGGGGGLADSMDTLGHMPRRQGATGGGNRRPVVPPASSISTHPTIDPTALTARIAGLEREAEALRTRLQEAERRRQTAEEHRDAEARARAALEEHRRREGEERRALEARMLDMERRFSEASHRRPSAATVAREGGASQPLPPPVPDAPSTGMPVPAPHGQSERRSSDASQRRPSVATALAPEGSNLPSDILEGGAVVPPPDGEGGPAAFVPTDDASLAVARVIARRESGVQTDPVLPLDAPEQPPTSSDAHRRPSLPADPSVPAVDGLDAPPPHVSLPPVSSEEAQADVRAAPTGVEVGAQATAPSAPPTIAEPCAVGSAEVGGGRAEEAGDRGDNQQIPPQAAAQPLQEALLPPQQQDLSLQQAYEADKARMTQKLTELRVQVSELYRQAQAKEQGMREQWETDKAALETQVLTLRHELLSVRTAHAQALQAQRDGYDEAIREMEEAAARQQQQLQQQQQQQQKHSVSDQEVAALRTEVERLRDHVKQLEAVAQAAEGAVKAEEEGGKGRRKSRGAGASALALLQGEQEEESAQETVRELALLRGRLEEAEARLEAEVGSGREAVTSVSTAFRAYREKQASIVSVLETRLREARRLLEQAKKGRKATIAEGAKRTAPTAGAGGGVPLPGHGPPKPASDFRVSEENEELLEVLAERERQLAEADSRLRRLHADLRTTEAERDRVIEVAVGGGGVGADRQRDAVVRAALLEAKLAVNTQVMEQLCREVEEERGAGNEVRRELAARVLQMATIRRLRAGPSTQSLTKQVTELKRASKTETARLKAIIKKLQTQVPEGEKYEEMKAEVASLRQWQASTREDLARKSKLLASLKATRSADESALSRWKAEVATLEQRVRSLNKDLYRKEVAIRELRGRVSEQEQQQEAALAGGVNAPTLVYPDARLKTVVAERDRLKQRCATLEKKAGEQAKGLHEATQQLKHYEDGQGKVASLRAALQRKDSLLKAAKAKILGYAQELSGLKAAAYQWQNEAERHLKQLQKRSMQAARYPPGASPPRVSGGEAPPLEEMRMQLRSLARADATGVRSLVLNVLAMMHEDGEEGAGGGSVLLGDEAAARGEQEPRPRRVQREGGGEEEQVEEEDKVQDLMDSIDHILAQPNAADSGRRLAALVDGFMDTSVGGGYV